MFESRATTLAPGTEAGEFQVFLRDRELGTTQVVSRGLGGSPADAGSGGPLISADGSTVAFHSSASNLVVGDMNGVSDVFVYDVATGGIERVSVSTNGREADSGVGLKGLSADGSRVAFESPASSLELGDTNGEFDAFVRFRNAGITRRVSVSATFAELNADSFCGRMSSNGRYVVFNTEATNVGTGDTTSDVDGYVVDLQDMLVLQVTVDEQGNQVNFDASALDVTDDLEASFVSESKQFTPVPLNSVVAQFVHSFESGENELVSVSSTSVQPFVHDVFLGGEFAGGGRYITFGTRSSVFEPGGEGNRMKLYVRDRLRQVTENVTVTSAGEFLTEDSTLYSISPDGRFVTYQTRDTTLVPGDANLEDDIFLLDRRRGSLDLELELLGGGAQAELRLTSGSAGGSVQVFYALGDQGLEGSPFGLLTQGDPSASFTTVLGPAGNRTLAVSVPAGFSGADVWLQALDATMMLLSAPVRVAIP